jgi:hypothetical protein
MKINEVREISNLRRIQFPESLMSRVSGTKDGLNKQNIIAKKGTL